MEDSTATAIEKGTEHKDLYLIESQDESNKRKIDFIQSEIDKISQDLDWLSSRIKEMELFKRFVPDKMYKSMEFKQNKIMILTKLKEQLKTVSKNEKKIKPVKKAPPSKKKSVGIPCGEKLIKERINQLGLADWIELVKDKGGARIENRLPIVFASGSSEIVEEYKTFLKNVAMVIKGCRVKILVNGYADTDPIHTAKYPSNSALGAARASNVVQTMIKNGISPSAFKIGTTGQDQSTGHKASKWKAINRHANLTIVLQP